MISTLGQWWHPVHGGGLWCLSVNRWAMLAAASKFDAYGSRTEGSLEVEIFSQDC